MKTSSKSEPRDIAQLLDRAPPAGYREEWAGLLAKPQVTLRSERVSVMVFRLGDEWLGLPTKWITEVGAIRAVHSLPHRRGSVVAGVANIHGELLPCIALERVLQIERSAIETSTRRLLVAGEGARRIAFIADEVHGVLQHNDRATMLPAPSGAICVTQILPWKNRTVGCLDVTALSSAIERRLHE